MSGSGAPHAIVRHVHSTDLFVVPDFQTRNDFAAPTPSSHAHPHGYRHGEHRATTVNDPHRHDTVQYPRHGTTGFLTTGTVPSTSPGAAPSTSPDTVPSASTDAAPSNSPDAAAPSNSPDATVPLNSSDAAALLNSPDAATPSNSPGAAPSNFPDTAPLNSPDTAAPCSRAIKFSRCGGTVKLPGAINSSDAAASTSSAPLRPPSSWSTMPPANLSRSTTANADAKFIDDTSRAISGADQFLILAKGSIVQKLASHSRMGASRGS
ncbi:hypothetical protein CYLTODRAFT_459121 [Cylindrobasidium torrendii FP15055 ss-10]|uniref:Uncharacterized protein n=1 Tax=Cylindrobasidium torrendii FP15055 ss-10 TaxID=1314674 RepID=A0A0D7AVQ3_9AGAR|nr:hypothetical protein CYLTODRAFT_459121 [Cylindrobasidium torrendii FP15055 ss-10]